MNKFICITFAKINYCKSLFLDNAFEALTPKKNLFLNFLKNDQNGDKMLSHQHFKSCLPKNYLAPKKYKAKVQVRKPTHKNVVQIAAYTWFSVWWNWPDVSQPISIAWINLVVMNWVSRKNNWSVSHIFYVYVFITYKFRIKLKHQHKITEIQHFLFFLFYFTNLTSCKQYSDGKNSFNVTIRR